MSMFKLSELLNKIYTARLPESEDLEQVLSLRYLLTINEEAGQCALETHIN